MPTDQPKQIGVRVDPSLWETFRSDVRERHGAVKGHLRPELEAAIRAYIDAAHGGDDNDKLTRIESRLESIESQLQESTKEKNAQDFSRTVENRLEAIRDTIAEEADGAPRVHEQVVEMAIKQHAGHSDPTLRQYKNRLKEQRDLFADPRPNQSYFFRDAPHFCVAVNEYYQNGPLGKADYLDLVENEYSREWWGDQVDTFEERHTETDGGTPGFQ